ncbi:MAG: type II CRISPR RNA-guided endonuclease Cas9 [Microscillaceae bacterium]|nr:type II CRISPR RNA-guided endonuclease Cas9 [Microscillaceae bacterium]
MVILGLDIGTSSIGWCLVDEATEKILGTGSVIFQEGVNRSPLGKEESRNASRRTAKQIRRQLIRKKRRKILLIKSLQAINWCPSNETELDNWRKLKPYELRAKALREPLNLYELGRVLYHLNQRRGFRSSRKSGDNDEGAMYKGLEGKRGISELAEAIEQGGFKTLGEYLASLNPHDIRLRNRYTLRSMYEMEFELIWESQLRFNPKLLQNIDYQAFINNYFPLKNFKDKRKTEYRLKLRDKLLQSNWKDFLKNYVIFYQRGLKSQKGLVGKCTLLANKRRAPKSSLLFQEFRILDKLHSIRVNGANRTDTPLTNTEFDKAFGWLNTAKEKTFKDLRKFLKLEEFDFNYPLEDKIKGNQTVAELKKVFGKDWDNLNSEKQNKIWEVVYMADSNDWLKEYGIKKWQLNPENAEKLKKVSFEKSYADLSHLALSQLVPLMKQANCPYHLACQQLGYHHSQVANNQEVSLNLLPEPKNIRNPIVQQALFVLRKLVNTLIQEYAIKPDIVRVELARELKMKKKDRENINLTNKRARDEHARIVKILLKEIPKFQKESEISREDIIKYKLWEECNEICPYTGKSINISQLYNGEFEIEHIFPYSRSMDDGFNNKTLCDRAFNLKKGKYTPYELQEYGIMKASEYEQMVERAKKLKRNGQFNYKKFKRFLQKTIDSDFVARQLNDTAWIAKEAKAWLSSICDKVQISMGEATAELRHLWGLNNILNKHGLNLKNREDHRHHALDALVVALTSPGMLQALSKNHGKGIKTSGTQFPEPWENFRQTAQDAINQILIYQRRKNRVRGKLHDETMYGAVYDMNGLLRQEGKDMRYFKIKKPLTSLSAAMINKIADPIVKKIVKERIRKMGENPDKQGFKIPTGCFNEPLYMYSRQGKKIQIKKVSIHDVSSNKILIREGVYVDSGNNHHIVIYQKPDGKRDGKVTSLYEAVQRQKYGQAVVNRNLGNDKQFVMSLSINEMVLIDDEKRNFNTAKLRWNENLRAFEDENGSFKNAELSPYLYRVQKIESGQLTITLRHHLTAVLKNEQGEEVGRKFANPNTFKGIKVKINILGEIAPADD